jgi:hypothetical protein
MTLIVETPFLLSPVYFSMVELFASTIAVSRTGNVVNPRAKKRAIKFFID